LIDCIDSSTFNLVQYLRSLGAEVCVMRSDEIAIQAALKLQPTHVVLGPGPGRPEAAQSVLELARAFLGRCPILGVCLGHQMLGLISGAKIVSAELPAHGKPQRVYHDGRAPFRGMPNPLEAGRYNSLVVDHDSIGEAFEVSAWSSEGEVLGLRHRELPVIGFQFHPESILTPQGMQMLKQFLKLESGVQAGREQRV
jgi:anthranilate synthase/aminodeoxychorismate synthase-like glutamine amidotransferase